MIYGATPRDERTEMDLSLRQSNSAEKLGKEEHKGNLYRILSPTSSKESRKASSASDNGRITEFGSTLRITVGSEQMRMLKMKELGAMLRLNEAQKFKFANSNKGKELRIVRMAKGYNSDSERNIKEKLKPIEKLEHFEHICPVTVKGKHKFFK